ncbi:MAG: lipid-binding SYLF domain-containing protein [Candidatus Scalindua sp.]|nr:lipid-binding SYLF domain-containing protein [Candidatus Scalindua sp.]MCR4344965.1 lipid-binding SYLF domain-containing protein [Candidatus Scalindua sp.]
MKLKIVLSIACCLFLAVTSNVYAVTKEDLTKRINRSHNYLEEIMEIPETSIPSTLLKSCQGIIIMRQYNAGFIFGAKVGQGIALTRDIKTRKWSAPAFVASGEASFGFQIGGQMADAVILIMNRYGVESLLFTKFKIGVDAALALGPVGRNTEAKIGPNTAFLVYSKSKGLYGGLTFEGGFISQDDGANKEFYGREISVKEIFQNEDNVPDEAKELIRTLEKYCNF